MVKKRCRYKSEEFKSNSWVHKILVSKHLSLKNLRKEIVQKHLCLKKFGQKNVDINPHGSTEFRS